MPYRLFVPANYDASKAYPLVLYLHHAGLVGTDNCIQLTEEIGSGGYGGVFVHSATSVGGAKFVTQTKYPHFLVAPQATNSTYGFGGGVAGSATATENATHALIYGILDQVRAEFPIDPRRIYVTGISMGCYGTWDMIMRKPDYFAAASPQSCQGDPNTTLLSKLVDAPIWSMCGTKDSYYAGAQAMAAAMSKVGATKFIFTPFEGVGHSIHDLGYDYPGFIDWLFTQSLEVSPSDGGAGGPSRDADTDVRTDGGTSAGGTSGHAGSGGASAMGSGGVSATGGASITGGSTGTAGTGGQPGGSGGATSTLPIDAGASGASGGTGGSAPREGSGGQIGAKADATSGVTPSNSQTGGCACAAADGPNQPYGLALVLVLVLPFVVGRRRVQRPHYGVHASEPSSRDTS